MIYKPIKLVVLTIILSTAITLSPSVYGDTPALPEDNYGEPLLQCDKYLEKTKEILSLYVSAIATAQSSINYYKNLQSEDSQRNNHALKFYIKYAEESIPFYKERVKIITGLKYSNPEQFIKWWEENSDYLYLSDNKKSLLVNEPAKKEKRILHKWKLHYPEIEDKCPKVDGILPEFEVPAKRYWLESISELQLKSYADDEEYIYIEVTNELTNDVTIKYMVNKSDIANYEKKLEAYIQFCEQFIEYTDLGDNKKAIKILKNITTKEYADHNSWAAWWNKNKDNLVLNKEGTKLVVKK